MISNLVWFMDHSCQVGIYHLSYRHSDQRYCWSYHCYRRLPQYYISFAPWCWCCHVNRLSFVARRQCRKWYTRWEQFLVDTDPDTQFGICSDLHALQLSGKPRQYYCVLKGCPATKRIIHCQHLQEQDGFQMSHRCAHRKLQTGTHQSHHARKPEATSAASR